jgi:hypothetical protein
LLAGRVGLSLPFKDCSPRVKPGDVPEIPNPSSLPGPTGTWGDDVFFEVLRDAGFDKEETERIIREFIGENLDDFLKKLGPWLSKCKKPICFIECGAQLYIDLKKAESEISPWQECCLRRTRTDCLQCCDDLRSTNEPDLAGLAWEKCWQRCSDADYEDE